MNQWQKSFMTKVNSLREKAAGRFDRFAEESLHPVAEEFQEFAGRCDFQCSQLQHQPGLCSYKFALLEDAFVLVFFRTKGVVEVECEFECYLPRQGKVESAHTSTNLNSVDREWVRAQFENALDSFVDVYQSAEPSPETDEVLAI